MQFWLPLIGTLIGASVALTSLWLKEWFDRRRELQKQYEQYYIVDGIDKIYAWLLIQKVQIRYVFYKYNVESLKTLQIPVEAIARIDFLLRDDFFSEVIYDIEGAKAVIATSIEWDSIDSPNRIAASQFTKDLINSNVNLIEHVLSAASDLRLRLMLYRVTSQVSLVHLSVWLMKWYAKEFAPKHLEQLKRDNILNDKLAQISVLKLKEQNVLLERILEIMNNTTSDDSERKQELDIEIKAWLANRKTVDEHVQVINQNTSAK